jgi:hypothetical protein
MDKRDTYVVDTYGMSRDAEIAACRTALELVAPEVGTFETDIPMAGLHAQPEQVAAAARHLGTHSKGRPDEGDAYRATGVISAENAEDWQALVIFAPFAYDATVWGRSSEELVSLADEGTSLVVHLRPQERITLEEAVGPDRVVPLKQWRRVRRRLLKERRRAAR